MQKIYAERTDNMQKDENFSDETGKNSEFDDFDIIPELNAVASSTECTGLIQIPPTNSHECESYGNIYSIPHQVNDFKNVKKPKGRATRSAPSE